MELRKLAERDFGPFSAFIRSVFRDSPYSMWFSGEPDAKELEELLSKKLHEIKRGRMIDIVAEESGSIIGECEIAAKGQGIGLVGILVDKRHRRKGLGGRLLESGIAESRRLGLGVLLAEVLDSNADALGFFQSNGFALDNDVEKSVEVGGRSYRYLIFRKRLK
ncbi:MAG: GNAT family N-acetyltransferase [Candidatus Micrarchaeota archaeon]|nr:GNAT family N-acetyltransferase [Candidatus Micrarchaeota archaeon]MDE1824168.1 GNAT family N-acetyltransferase [Candidatus Micrarchaeota archaeon]MDE1849417.1 GNAT family N-acetyltransferase [Candidatus Micrarchaeota archaeon]